MLCQIIYIYIYYINFKLVKAKEVIIIKRNNLVSLRNDYKLFYKQFKSKLS